MISDYIPITEVKIFDLNKSSAMEWSHMVYCLQHVGQIIPGYTWLVECNGLTCVHTDIDYFVKNKVWIKGNIWATWELKESE